MQPDRSGSPNKTSSARKLDTFCKYALTLESAMWFSLPLGCICTTAIILLYFKSLMVINKLQR